MGLSVWMVLAASVVLAVTAVAVGALLAEHTGLDLPFAAVGVMVTLTIGLVVVVSVARLSTTWRTPVWVGGVGGVDRGGRPRRRRCRSSRRT